MHVKPVYALSEMDVELLNFPVVTRGIAQRNSIGAQKVIPPHPHRPQFENKL